VPVSQVIGNIPAPVSAPVTIPGSAAPAYGGGTVYGGGGTVYNGPIEGYGGQAAFVPRAPAPADFHWALVLLICIVTCGIFGWAWFFVEAAYLRKIKPDSKGVLFGILALSSAFIGGLFNGFSKAMSGTDSPVSGLFSLVAFVLIIVALFQVKSDLEDYYNVEEPINLRLSGVMTFFFGILYFQYHLSRIAQWKKSGVLQPQGQ
jgi:hypothetical protein